MIALLYEDRPAALTGLKIAVLSLRRQHPDLPVWVMSPDAPDGFIAWSSDVPGLHVETEPSGVIGRGWSVKPNALMTMLDRGHQEVLWVDSDIVLTGDLTERLCELGSGTLVVTEEYFWGHCQGGPGRTLALGLEVGRTFATTLNSGIMRATQAHLSLLRAWNEILVSRDFVSAQALPAAERPLEYFTDQEVLTGLLGSTAFAHIPVELLRRGRDIAQCFGPSGFTPSERLRCGRSLPLAVHAMGAKPWLRQTRQNAVRSQAVGGRLSRYYEQLHLELTPYVAAARSFRNDLDEDTSWMEPDSALGRALHHAIPVPALEELPLAALDSAQRRVRRLLGIRQLKPSPPRVSP